MENILKWLNLQAFIAMIIVNALANIIPIGGNTTGEVSANLSTLFTPAPFTFIIWGLIYLLMGIFIITQFFITSEESVHFGITSDIGIWFILSCLLNIAWIFSWHNRQIGLSLLCIIGLLLTLIMINRNLIMVSSMSVSEKISVYGFNIYLGWICAATIANVSVFLKSTQWSQYNDTEAVWTIFMIIFGTLLGITLTLVGHRFMATFSIMWAYYGIFIKHMSETGYNASYPLIMIITAIAIISMLIMILLTAIVPEFQLLVEY